jgi:guanylate kinase
MLLIVSGASGVGKTSLCSKLLAEFDEVELSVSYTTRAPRGQERDGVEYNFVDVPRFREMVEEGQFAEWAEVHGNLYGTTRAAIDGAFERGRSVLFDIDYQGARQLRERYPGAVTVMVVPPDMPTIEARLRSRGDTDGATVARRVNKAREEMSHAGEFDFVVVNDDLHGAYLLLSSIYRAGLARTARVWPRVKYALNL